MGTGVNSPLPLFEIIKRIRAMLDSYYSIDTDLDAFIHDHFKKQFMQLNGRMERDDKIMALFRRKTAIEILHALCCDRPDDAELKILLSKAQEVPAPVSESASPSSPMNRRDLREVLPGTWSMAIDSATEVVLSIEPSGSFQGSIHNRSSSEVRTLTGSWQIRERRKLLLQGQQLLGQLLSPFVTNLEFEEIGEQELRAISNHQVVVWQRRV